MKRKVSNNTFGVTEIMGTMLLLTIAIVVMSYVFFTVSGNLNPTPYVNSELLAKIDQNDVVIEHQGGESLDIDTAITLSIGGRCLYFPASYYLSDAAKSDGLWNIGERVIFPASGFRDVTDLEVDIDSVIDIKTNTNLMYGNLQDGIVFPYRGMGGIWHFDEGTGNNAYDSSGNNNTGQVIDGQWNDSVAISNNSIYFDEVDDYVQIDSSFSLNMLDQISIEAWFNPLGNTASIDDYNFDSAFAYNPDVIHIHEDIFAIAYIDSSNDVILKTLIIEEDGDIENGYIDLLDVSSLDSNSCNDPNLVKINGTVYGVCYSSNNNGNGWVKTYRINETGMIFDEISNNTLVFDSTNCYYPNITHVSGDIYAIAYEGQNKGIIKTIEILPNGFITQSIVDSYTFDPNSIEKPRIIRLQNNYFAVAYISKTKTLDTQTFFISDGGAINYIDSNTFNIDQCDDPDIVHILNEVYAIAYASSNRGQGNVVTFSITPAGMISDTIDSFIFDDVKCEDPDIIKVYGDTYEDYFAIAYASSSPHVGQVVTIEIHPNGTIEDTVSHEFVYNGHHGFEPKILPVFGDLGVYLVVYRGYSPHVGYISTTLTVTDPTLPQDRGLFKDGVFSIYGNATHIFGSINDVSINSPFEPGWTHVVLTYDGEEIRLYLNGVLEASTSYTEPLNTNSNDIQIGYLFHGYIDEITIYEYTLFPSEVLDHYNELRP